MTRRTLAYPALLGLALALACPADAGGQVTVTDGDSLSIDGQRIRLHAIDAPELGQTCADGWPAGRAARARLAAMVDGQPVRCEPLTVDRYGRTVARCFAGAKDLGGAMVAAGMAWPFLRYGGAEYQPQEQAARALGLGVHAHDCIPPAEYRARRRG